MDFTQVPRGRDDDARVFAVVNQKGGVGKSTTSVNLAAALGELGRKVLLIDLDPQGNSTSGLGVDKNLCTRCVYDVLLGEAGPEDLVTKVEATGVWVMPATIQLAGAEIELVSAMSRETRLKGVTQAMKPFFDYIFIDCPPSLGLLTVNALTAADALIIPIQTEFYALEGVSKLLDSMRLVKTHLNPALDIFGVVMTMSDTRTKLTQQVINEVREFFGDKVFDTYVPRTVRLSEAPGFGQPITLYDPNGKGAAAYRAIAKEVIERG